MGLARFHKSLLYCKRSTSKNIQTHTFGSPVVRESGPQPTDTFGGENDVTWRDDHGSGLDLTGSGLKPILAGSELERTAFFFKIGGSGLDQD